MRSKVPLWKNGIALLFAIGSLTAQAQDWPTVEITIPCEKSDFRDT